MKKTILLFALFLGVIVLQAQPTIDEINLLQSAYGMEKRAIVEGTMKLTEAESAGFWKVYEEYEASRKEYGKKRVAIIVDYAKSYDGMTDEKASELVKASLSNQMTLNKLQQSTFTKLAKVVGAKRAAQFTQVESYLETVIRLKISDEIPFIGELEDTRKN